MIVIARIIDARDDIEYTGVYSDRVWKDRVRRLVDETGIVVEAVMALSIEFALSRLDGIPGIDSALGEECIFLNADAKTIIEMLKVFSPR